MQPAASQSPTPGQILAGKYRVEKVLGEGGMGFVLAAQHIHLGTRVAIKFLLPALAQRSDAVARFVREARAAATIQSEHVVRISDVSALEDGTPYMVMEYLTGQDLSQCAQTQGMLPVRETVDYVLQACEALAEAHRCGIVHRDLKPSNLFLAQRMDGSISVKVLDFGISKVQQGDGLVSNLTATSTVMGSPMYMSPEQIRSAKNVDARSDIWSLGVIMHELLSGRLPFEAETLASVCVAIATDTPVPIRATRPDLPEALDRIVMRCLEKDMTRRFQNVAELASALLPFGSEGAKLSVDRIKSVLGSSGAVGMAMGATGPAAPGTTTGSGGATVTAFAEPALNTLNTQSSFGTTQPPRSGKGLLIGLSVMSTLLVLGIGATAAVLFLRHREPAPADSSGLSSQASAPTASQPVVDTAPTAPAGAMVTLELRVEPEAATVEVNGVQLQGHSLKLPRSEQAQTVVVRAPGFMTESRSFVPLVDGVLEVHLKPEEKAAQPPPRTPGKSENPGGKGPNKVNVKGPVEKEL